MSKLNETIPFIGVRGDVLIETRDAKTGKLAQHSEGHNLFTNYGLERFRKYCVAGIGAGFGANAYFSENGANDVYPQISGTSWGFLKYLYLTDNEVAVSANSRRIPGVLTGWADRMAYAGADITKGTINANETILGRDGLKCVFDFATDKANGTHKSVFWGDQATLATYNARSNYSPLVSSGAKGLRGYQNYVQADDGYIYGHVETALYKIDPTTCEEIATYTLPAKPGLNAIFDVYAGNLYFCTSGESTTLYVFTLSDSTNTTKTLPAAASTWGGAIIDGYLYYPYSSTRIYKYDLSAGTGIYNSITLPDSNGFIVRSGSDLYYISFSSALLYSYDYSTNTLTSKFTLPSQYTRSTYNLPGKLLYLDPLTSYVGGTPNTVWAFMTVDLTILTANMITGRVLDTPITKDNTQTMKVTYTITFS